MSQGRFASITADILARKGEARPWGTIIVQPPERRPENQVRPGVHGTPQKKSTDTTVNISAGRSPPQSGETGTPDSTWKKCSVRVSRADYERLGIMAVKHNSSRHQLLQEAVAQFFENMARRYRDTCPCLGACDCSAQMMES